MLRSDGHRAHEEKSVKHKWLAALLLPLTLALVAPAAAVSSAELYQNQVYTYGRFEARVRFAAGDGVISSFFLWKPGSEVAGTFWNELDFEKLGADCHLQTNPLYGSPVADHSAIAAVAGDLCAEYHTYTFEWTPTYIAYLVDGIEVRRDTGETATAFAVNAAAGMQIHFNVWPGDATFGGNFDPAILPIQQYISWVQYSSFANDTFTLLWREDFAGGALPSGWSLGNWPSPKNLSTHAVANVGFVSEVAVLSLTADEATGFDGEPPPDNEAAPGSGDAGTGGGAGTASGGASSGGPSTGGASTAGGSAGVSPSPAANGGDSSSAPLGTPAGAGGAGSGQPLSNDTPRGVNDGGCSYRSAASRSADGVVMLALGALLLSQRRRRPASDASGRRLRHEPAAGARSARSQ
jgi:hypothetical protein